MTTATPALTAAVETAVDAHPGIERLSGAHFDALTGGVVVSVEVRIVAKTARKNGPAVRYISARGTTAEHAAAKFTYDLECFPAK